MPQIARHFNRDHTTILHGIRTARKRLGWDVDTIKIHSQICSRLGIKSNYAMRDFSSTRVCMSCGQPFVSEGKENRLCRDDNCVARRRNLSSSVAT